MHRTKEVVIQPSVEMDDKESQHLWNVITKWYGAEPGHAKGARAININQCVEKLMTKAYILGQKEGPSEIKQGF